MKKLPLSFKGSGTTSNKAPAVVSLFLNVTFIYDDRRPRALFRTREVHVRINPKLEKGLALCQMTLVSKYTQG